MIAQMDRRLVFGIGLTWAENLNNPPPDYDQQMAARLVAAHCQSTCMGFGWDMIDRDYPGQGLWNDPIDFDYRVNLISAQGIDIVGLIAGTPWWAKPIDVSGTVTGAGNFNGEGYLDDATGPFDGVNTYKDKYEVKITSGAGAGQVRWVRGNTSTRLTVDRWDVVPEPGSTYILGGHAAFVLPVDTPANRDALRNFCASLASRYLGKIRYFEFWNEPDGGLMLFNVAEYTSWLVTPYQGVKLGNPNALLSVGGLENADNGYLEGIYNNGGQPYFEAVAVHPYPLNDTGPINFDSINGKRGVMESHGDSAKSMWLTEYGWEVDDNNPQTLINQSNWLLQSLQTLWTPPYYFVTQANYHIIADHEKPPPPTRYGLCKADLTPRPAYYIFRDYTDPRTPKAYSLAPFVTQVI